MTADGGREFDATICWSFFQGNATRRTARTLRASEIGAGITVFKVRTIGVAVAVRVGPGAAGGDVDAVPAAVLHGQLFEQGIAAGRGVRTVERCPVITTGRPFAVDLDGEDLFFKGNGDGR